MKNFRTSLRNVAISFACLAATMIFASCEKEDDPIDVGTEQDADIVAFTFDGIDGRAAIDKAAHSVTAKAGEEVDLTTIVAEFTLSTNATATVGGKAQVSKQTANNFTSPLTYKVTSGDGATTNDWTVTVTGGKTGGTGGGNWAKVNTANFGEYYDFFPTGTFLVQREGESIAYLFAKNADGSLITSKIEKNPSAQAFNQNHEYRIWHEDMYWWVNHEYRYAETGGWIGSGEIVGDIFYTLSLKTPDGTIRNPQRMTIDAPYGGVAAAVAADFNPLRIIAPFDAFVNSYNRDEAVFEKNDVVAGIPCKKYVSESSLFKSEWWILENGFCLKNSSVLNGQVTVIFEVYEAELNTSTYDYVTQKYGKFGQVNAIPPVTSMVKATEGIQGANWIAPASFLPWTAGGFNIMVNFRALDWEGFPVHQIYIGFPDGTDMPTALNAYKAEIMKIPNMRELPGNGSTTLARTWKYNNQTEDAESYWYFELRSMSGLANMNGNPYQIFIQLIDVIFV